jgi:hypothetical protein
LTQHPRATLEALSDDQRALLGRVLDDALDHRTPSGECSDCDKSGAGLCLNHADDFGLVRAYRELGDELGLEAGAGREAGS